MDSATQYNWKVYETQYTEQHLRHCSRFPYDAELVAFKLRLLRRYAKGKVVADLGCGIGEYLLSIVPFVKRVYGIDFSPTMLRVLRKRIPKTQRKKIILRKGDIQHLPLPSAHIDFAYSIATLYHVPKVSKAIAETARILKPGGIVLFDLGNLWSLNTIITLRSPTGVRSYHLPVSEMEALIRANRLEILEHHTFQLFPMYGISAWWMLPLLPFCLPQLKYLMGMKIRGKMLDEIISSLPLLNRFASRHLFVCRKKIE